MTTKNLPDGLALDPDTFGVVVNNKVDTPDEWIEKADHLTLPLTFTINLPSEQKHRLERIASDAGRTVDDYLQQIIVEHMTTSVAKPMITGPSAMSGKTTSKRRITGPTYSVTRG